MREDENVKIALRSIKYVLAMIMLLIVISSISGCVKDNRAAGESTDQTIDQTPIMIGFIGPLSGGQAPFGKSQVEAITMLAEDINAKGGIDGRKIELIIEDDLERPSAAVTAAQKLIESDRVVAIVGDMQSGAMMALPRSLSRQKFLRLLP